MIKVSNNFSLIKKATTQVYTLLLISISSLIVIIYIFFQILSNLINILKKYNEKVTKRSINFNKVMSQNLANNDDNIYDKNTDKFIENKNLNKEILKSIENQKHDQEKTLQNITTLKKNLHMNATINSKVNNKVLSDSYDNLNYQKPPSRSFWSNLFFTQ